MEENITNPYSSLFMIASIVIVNFLIVRTILRAIFKKKNRK